MSGPQQQRRHGSPTAPPFPAIAASLAAAGVILFAVHCGRVLGATVDDAFIVFRYAWNLAEGAGPTFNAGQPPVEGVTQVLWLWSMTLPVALGLDVVVASKVAGIGLALVTFVALWRLTSRVGALAGLEPRQRGLAAAAAVVAVAALPFTALHAVAGLGTSLFTLLVVLHARACVAFLSAPTRLRAAGVGVGGLLLGLGRPEGNLLAGVAIALTAVLAARSPRVSLLRWVAATYLVPGAVYFGLRSWYYGLLMPLPFHVKLRFRELFGAAEGSGLQVGLDVLTYLGPAWVPIALLGAWRWPRPSTPALGAAAVFLGIQTLPAQVMGYGWRYFFPALPILAVVVGIGVGRAQALCDLLLRRRAARAPGEQGQRGAHRGASAVSAAIGAVMVAGLVVFTARGADRQLETWVRYGRGLQMAHMALGERLREIRPQPYAATVAIGDAGAVPFVSRWRSIDTYGLNDPGIALSGTHDAGRVLDAEPDVLVLLSKHPFEFVPWLPWEQELYAVARTRGLELAKVLEFSEDYFLWVLCAERGDLWHGLRAWSPPGEAIDPFDASRGEQEPDVWTRVAVDADHGDFRIAEVALSWTRLALRVERRAPVERRFTFFVHVLGGVGPDVQVIARHDFVPTPQLRQIEADGQRVYLRRIDPPLEPGAVVRIGVFDPDAPPHPPVPDLDGRPFFELTLR